MNDSFVTKISINSVRNIKDTVIELSDKEAKNLIVTGLNGSGKTSLLQALWKAISGPWSFPPS